MELCGVNVMTNALVRRIVLDRSSQTATGVELADAGSCVNLKRVWHWLLRYLEDQIMRKGTTRRLAGYHDCSIDRLAVRSSKGWCP